MEKELSILIAFLLIMGYVIYLYFCKLKGVKQYVKIYGQRWYLTTVIYIDGKAMNIWNDQTTTEKEHIKIKEKRYNSATELYDKLMFKKL